MGGFSIATLLEGLQIRMNTQPFLVMGHGGGYGCELRIGTMISQGHQVVGKSWVMGEAPRKRLTFHSLVHKKGRLVTKLSGHWAGSPVIDVGDISHEIPMTSRTPVRHVFSRRGAWKRSRPRRIRRRSKSRWRSFWGNESWGPGWPEYVIYIYTWCNYRVHI